MKMSEDSEEACLVNPKSPTVPPIAKGLMPYTDGVQTYSQYGAQMNSSDSRMGSGANPSMNGGTNVERNRSGNGTIGGAIGLNRGSQSHESESGDLIDYNDDILISQFHSDAIKQTGCGKFQLYACLIIGLGLAGHAIQTYAVLYILPSAEVEYCIVEHEKSWLSSITFLGLNVGALLWGGLAGQTGRRKTLLSCLSVASIFSIVAAFMPTYGPFMMARFCAAVGFGGVFPAGTSYISEITPQHARTRLLSLLGTIGIGGGVFAGGLAMMIVPKNGQMIVIDNKEHFSAWHRYLLLVSLPTFGAILGLFWLPESPRWLLENAREVEALSIYQRIYRWNRARGGYTLTELELPSGSRNQRNQIPASVLAGMAHSIQTFFGGFLQLFHKSYARTTIFLIGSWAAALFVFHGLTIFIAEHSRNIQIQNYSDRMLIKDNQSFENFTFSSNFDNVKYTNTKFLNCTFRQMFMVHVKFNNCSFIDTDFVNVQTSRTFFQNSFFETVKFIDTDLTERHFINCTRNNTGAARLQTICDQDFDYNIFIDSIWRSNMGTLIPASIAIAFIGEFIHRFGRSRIATTCFSFATMLCCAFGFLFIDEHVIWTGGTAQALILAGLVSLTVFAIENYTTSLRCTALGLIICGGHIGALISAPIYTSLQLTSTNIAAILSTFAMAFPVLSSAALQDPCTLL